MQYLKIKNHNLQFTENSTRYQINKRQFYRCHTYSLTYCPILASVGSGAHECSLMVSHLSAYSSLIPSLYFNIALFIRSGWIYSLITFSSKLLPTLKMLRRSFPSPTEISSSVVQYMGKQVVMLSFWQFEKVFIVISEST